jgi:hypothetical protein
MCMYVCVCPPTVLSNALERSQSIGGFIGVCLFERFGVFSMFLLNFLALLLAMYILRIQYVHISSNLTVNEVCAWLPESPSNAGCDCHSPYVTSFSSSYIKLSLTIRCACCGSQCVMNALPLKNAPGDQCHTLHIPVGRREHRWGATTRVFQPIQPGNFTSNRLTTA